MAGRVAVSESLSPLKQVLHREGYEVLKLKTTLISATPGSANTMLSFRAWILPRLSNQSG